MAIGPTEKFAAGARRRIYLVRHAEVSYFDALGQPYRPNTVPLNEEGRQQAAAMARALAEVRFDRVVSSDLSRTQESAVILTAGRGLTLEAREELREIQPGRLADIPAESLEHAFVGAFAGAPTRETQFLGGETFGSLEDRVLRCFRGLLVEPAWRCMLMVAHGGVNRTILAHALSHGPQAFGAIEQDAGCINVIDLDSRGRFLVRLVNYTPYNPAKIGLELTTMERLYRELQERVASAGWVPPKS